MGRCYNLMLKDISKILNININDLQIFENAILKKFKNDNYYIVGEIDALIFNKKSKQVIAVCEIKRNLDDISSALYQINRTYTTIIENSNFLIEYNEKTLPASYFNNIKNYTEKQCLINSFIYTMIDFDANYFNLPSKI